MASWLGGQPRHRPGGKTDIRREGRSGVFATPAAVAVTEPQRLSTDSVAYAAAQASSGKSHTISPGVVVTR